jgi:hypothetical protein
MILKKNLEKKKKRIFIVLFFLAIWHSLVSFFYPYGIYAQSTAWSYDGKVRYSPFFLLDSEF